MRKSLAATVQPVTAWASPSSIHPNLPAPGNKRPRMATLVLPELQQKKKSCVTKVNLTAQGCLLTIVICFVLEVLCKVKCAGNTSLYEKHITFTSVLPHWACCNQRFSAPFKAAAAVWQIRTHQPLPSKVISFSLLHTCSWIEPIFCRRSHTNYIGYTKLLRSIVCHFFISLSHHPDLAITSQINCHLIVQNSKCFLICKLEAYSNM